MTPSDAMMDAVVWEPYPVPPGFHPDQDGLPYAIAQGELRIGDLALKCYQLSDGRRLIDGNDVSELFACLGGGD